MELRSQLPVAAGRVPENKFNLQISLDPLENFEVDVIGRYTGRLTGFTETIDPYFSVDARLAFRASNYLELSVVGQNLLKDHHEEFGPPLGTIPFGIERGIYGKATWEF